MSFFGFGDIKFNKGQSAQRKGPLAPLTSSPFERQTLRFPLDIGNFDKGHYVVFYIREQITSLSQFASRAAGEGDLKSFNGGSGGIELSKAIPGASGASNSISKFGSSILGKINSAISKIPGSGTPGTIGSALSKAGTSVTNSVSNLFAQSNVKFTGSSQSTQEVVDTSIKRITGGSLSFLRNTRLTKDAIALYMPDTLQYSYAQSFDQMNLGDEGLGQILAAGDSAIDKFKKDGVGGALSSVGQSALQSFISRLSDRVASATGQKQSIRMIEARLTGRVKNPMLEMIYKSPDFRKFQFDFLFYPRDEREALEVQKIIESFRFHQAPEKMEDAGAFLIPPSEFDIRFYYGGAENPNIPQIATCILTNMETNYAPNGFTAYEVPGEDRPALGRTGMPVAIQMALSFQEVTYLTKQDFRSDLIGITKAAIKTPPASITGQGGYNP